MSDLEKLQRAERLTKDDLPKRGEFYWVKFIPNGSDDPATRDEKQVAEDLFCVTHIASNHVEFTFIVPYSDGRDTARSQVRYRFRDLPDQIRPAPDWKAVLEKRFTEKQAELREAVMALADKCSSAGLIGSEEASPVETLAVATQRHSPKEIKDKLTRLKSHTLPAAKKRVDRITTEMIAIQKMIIMPERAAFEYLTKAMGTVDERLFALELYAGLLEEVIQIRKGTPADPEAPLTIRQMLRYMDEETLIAVTDGGADFGNLKDFDAWVAQDENLNRMAPEPRCVVAFKVRRHRKDYGRAKDLGTAMAHIAWQKEDAKTYLLLRNGENVFRLMTDQDFEPRMIPLSEELDKPFTKEGWWNSDRNERDRIPVGPDDFDYDDQVEERRKVVMQYNRIMFLLQGLLDRSEVFNPHPPMNLSSPDILQRYIHVVRDEEASLPQANPPEWEAYRDEKNIGIRKGVHVWAWVEIEGKWNSRMGRHNDDYTISGMFTITRVSKDRKTVTVSKPGEGTRCGWKKVGPWGRRKWGEWPVTTSTHYDIPLEQCFNVQAYRPGDYKTFLCDAFQRGKYLRWAPPLLAAERWHKERRKKLAEEKSIK